ncbi:hypothetical protein ACVWWN_000190 [Mycobacterium sp. URHB0021]
MLAWPGLLAYHTGDRAAARTDSSDMVKALNAGADDYVRKPFGMDEFLARLRAAVRRAAASDTHEPVIETSSFTMKLSAKKVTKNGSEVHLTPTECGMLEMLVRNRGKLVGREELLKEMWGRAYAKDTHYLRVYLQGCVASWKMTRRTRSTCRPKPAWDTDSTSNVSSASSTAFARDIRPDHKLRPIGEPTNGPCSPA